jgi:NAD(P)-dependent dehydrogenase (short-subunit alcohol dehydrogenase family)
MREGISQRAGSPARDPRFDLTGRTVVLTGGGAGIGRAIALTLARHGAQIGILDRIASRIHAVADEIAAAGATAWGIAVDITDDQAAETAIKQIAERGRNLDVLINCAGILDGLRPAATTPRELWDRVLAVNLNAAFILTRAVLPHMLRARSGSIINIASEAGLRGGIGGAAYTVSKHGLVGLTRSVAWAYREDGIRCNAVCPGGIGATEILNDTSIDPADAERWRSIMSLAGEPGEPQSIANAVLFLASDESAYVNGVLLPVDGGWSAG